MVMQLGNDIDINYTVPGITSGEPAHDSAKVTFITLDSVVGSLPASVAAKDKPYLTVNDMIYAVRLGLVAAWSAKAFAQGNYVTHLGKTWYASSAAAGTDIPGTASLWKPTTAPV